MRHSTRPAANLITMSSDELVNRLLALREALTARRESPASVAVSIWDLIDDVRRSAVAPVAGGSPDDFEEVSAEFLEDPAGWPAYPDAECDGCRWTTEPTPIEVLERDLAAAWELDPTPESLASAPYNPTEADWLELAEWSASLDSGRWTDADQVRAHGCC